jgi:hypothetical protein
MADPFVAEQSPGISPGASDAAVRRFAALSGDVRGCAILGPDGIVSATGNKTQWAEAADALLAAADRAAGEQATHAHVATEEGEVFAVRSGALAMVAVTARFSLSSLVFADMRAALREAKAAPASAPAKAA